MVGLADFQKRMGTTTVRPSWLTIKNGESKQLTFLGEPKDFKIVVEHVSPEDWKKRGICTYNTGHCFACEQRAYGWNQNIRIYIPVLMNQRPYVIAQGIGANSVLHDLVQAKRERGIIRDVVFDVSRKGEGKRSAYSAVPTDTPAPLYKTQVDIESLLNNITYDKQKTYYKE